MKVWPWTPERQECDETDLPQPPATAYCVMCGEHHQMRTLTRFIGRTAVDIDAPVKCPNIERNEAA